MLPASPEALVCPHIIHICMVTLYIYAWSHYTYMHGHIIHICMVTLHIYAWSHYTYMHGHIIHIYMVTLYIYAWSHYTYMHGKAQFPEHLHCAHSIFNYICHERTYHLLTKK